MIYAAMRIILGGQITQPTEVNGDGNLLSYRAAKEAMDAGESDSLFLDGKARILSVELSTHRTPLHLKLEGVDLAFCRSCLLDTPCNRLQEALSLSLPIIG